MEFKTDVLLHGGDYNPDQWLDRPDILERDAEMLAESGCNVVSLGIFGLVPRWNRRKGCSGWTGWNKSSTGSMRKESA